LEHKKQFLSQSLTIRKNNILSEEVVKYGVLKRRPDMEKLRDDFISFSIV